MALEGKVDVASVLERETQVTISSCLACVEERPDLLNIPLSPEERCAHLPEMLGNLVACLGNPLPLGSRAMKSPSASAHGRLQYNQGYTAPTVVEESRMLRVSIFQNLQMNVEDIEPRVLLRVMAVADEVDSQLAQALTKNTSPKQNVAVSPSKYDVAFSSFDTEFTLSHQATLTFPDV
jgi:hypothetical protein